MPGGGSLAGWHGRAGRLRSTVAATRRGRHGCPVRPQATAGVSVQM